MTNLQSSYKSATCSVFVMFLTSRVATARVAYMKLIP